MRKIQLKDAKVQDVDWKAHQVRGWNPCTLRIFDDGRQHLPLGLGHRLPCHVHHRGVEVTEREFGIQRLGLRGGADPFSAPRRVPETEPVTPVARLEGHCAPAGYAGLVWVLLAPLVSRLGRRNTFFGLGLTAACVWSADLIALGIKAATERARPFESIPGVDALIGVTVGNSLPSGHAATSFAGAVILTHLWPRAAPFAFFLAVAIAFSRVYVGVHYPSDVLAGAALGALVALAALGALRLRRRTSAARRRSAGAPPGG